MSQFNTNRLEGTDSTDITGQLEGAILATLWQRTNEYPACGNTAPLRIGRVETNADGRDAESNCELCDLLLKHALD